MITISQTTEKDIPLIQSIAYRTWPDTFENILSAEQIDYMLDMMYRTNALHEQITVKNHHFLLAFEEEEAVGFISYETNYAEKAQTKVHKIYVLPGMHGKSIGRKLIEAVEKIAQENDNHSLLLNVNRENKAILFYEKMGFHKAYTEEIPIGNDFWMIDYVMIKENI